MQRKRFYKVYKGMLMGISVISVLVGLAGCAGKKDPLKGEWSKRAGDNTPYFVFYDNGSFKFAEHTIGAVNGKYELIDEDTVELVSNDSGLGNDGWHICGIRDFTINDGVLEFDGIGGEYYKIK